MRNRLWLMISFAIVLVLLVGTMAVLLVDRPWVQVLGDSVLRTNAPSKLVADAEQVVIEKHQNFIDNPDGSRSDPSYQGGGQSWKTGSSPDHVTAQVTRGTTQITDKDGHTLVIERITGSGAPLLIFIEFDGPGGTQSITSELLTELENRGVTVR